MIPLGISIDILFDTIIILPYVSSIMTTVGRSLVVAGFVGLVTSVAGKEELVRDVTKEWAKETADLVEKFRREALMESLNVYGNTRIAEIWKKRTEWIMRKYASRPWVRKEGSEVIIERRKRSPGVPGYVEFYVSETITYMNMSNEPVPLPPWNKIAVVTWDQYARKQRSLVLDPTVKYFVVPGEPSRALRMMSGPQGYKKPEEGPMLFIRGEPVIPSPIAEDRRSPYLHEYSIPSHSTLETGEQADVRFEATLLLPEDQNYYLYLIPDFGEGLTVTFRSEEKDIVIDGVPVYSDPQCETLPRTNVLQTCTVPLSGAIFPGDFVRFDWSLKRMAGQGSNPDCGIEIASTNAVKSFGPRV